MKKILAVALMVVAGLFMFSASTALAGPLEGLPCNGNFDGDDDVDGAEMTEFLVHFGRGTYNDPCPFSSTVPKTGQTTSYATGDDGDLEKGLAWPNPRFTDNSNGTITDNLTGLIWLKNANCFGERNWEGALSDCYGLADGSCGLTDGSTWSDWRLPNRFELESLFNLGYFNPAISHTSGFTQVQSDLYWSSTTVASGGINAWFVGMGIGDLGLSHKANNFYVWPVRGGQ